MCCGHCEGGSSLFFFWILHPRFDTDSSLCRFRVSVPLSKNKQTNKNIPVSWQEYTMFPCKGVTVIWSCLTKRWNSINTHILLNSTAQPLIIMCSWHIICVWRTELFGSPLCVCLVSRLQDFTPPVPDIPFRKARSIVQTAEHRPPSAPLYLTEGLTDICKFRILCVIKISSLLKKETWNYYGMQLPLYIHNSCLSYGTPVISPMFDCTKQI